ncbi:STAS domain-containing protein [Pseudonocardia sp.]|uniref:STAS domain-containing protein n=1 Tax=Pseudonocardia sp. TaxID=60912 RepID=UPI003458C55F
MATEHRASGTTLHISGDLDAATAPTLTVRVDEVLQIGGDIRLDLSKVALLGSAGLAAPVHARKAAAVVSTSL